MMLHINRLPKIALLFVLVAASITGVIAQETTEVVDNPTAYQLTGINHEFQGWNNCGPATVTNALTYFGYGENQTRAANWLKPNGEDKNVTPYQMSQFVNSQVPELPVFSLVRYGGNNDLLKTLISNNFPVIIEEGYEPEGYSWMGHYLLVTGYDDTTQEFTTQDSFLGANYEYSYDHFDEFWKHFNYTYIVLYESAREPELLELLGEDADVNTNIARALEVARADAIENTSDPFAWFNLGTNFTNLGMYQEAALAYDEARKYGLPWRMSWYQFGPFEAYYQVGRYDDMLTLVSANLNDGGGHFVEETFYYAGMAYEGKGDIQRALNNYQEAINFNPNFTPAVEALARLQNQT